MAESAHQPHDKLVQQVLSDPSEMESLLCVYLPTELTAQIDWPTLNLLKTGFIDEEFQKSESDILYSVQHKTVEETIYLYLLFEHQSSPDHKCKLKHIGNGVRVQ